MTFEEFLAMSLDAPSPAPPADSSTPTTSSSPPSDPSSGEEYTVSHSSTSTSSSDAESPTTTARRRRRRNSTPPSAQYVIGDAELEDQNEYIRSLLTNSQIRARAQLLIPRRGTWQAEMHSDGALGSWLFFCWRLLSAHDSYFKQKRGKKERMGEPYPPFGPRGANPTLEDVASIPLGFANSRALFEEAVDDSFERQRYGPNGVRDLQEWAPSYGGLRVRELERLFRSYYEDRLADRLDQTDSAPRRGRRARTLYATPAAFSGPRSPHHAPLHTRQRASDSAVAQAPTANPTSAATPVSPRARQWSHDSRPTNVNNAHPQTTGGTGLDPLFVTATAMPVTAAAGITTDTSAVGHVPPGLSGIVLSVNAGLTACGLHRANLLVGEEFVTLALTNDTLTEVTPDGAAPYFNDIPQLRAALRPAQARPAQR